MQKALLCAVAALLLVANFISCRSKDYEIESTQVTQNGFITMTDHTNDPGKYTVEAPGDTVFAYTVPKMDTAFTVKASTSEQFGYGWRRGALWLMALGILILLVDLGWFIKRTSSGDDKPAYMIPLLVGIVAAGMLIGGSLNWWAGQEESIPKATYDLQMKQYGNLGHWWPTKQK